MKKLFIQFSFIGDISGHVVPETPDSIHEGGGLNNVDFSLFFKGVRSGLG